MIARYLALAPAAAMALLTGCGDPAARVTLAPIAHGACGRPTTATGVRITAYATSGEVTRAVGTNEVVDVADFPADTEQLGVEVTVGGGTVGAAGKSVPLVFGDLPTGTTIPVFMAPPGGLCATAGPLGEPRRGPLLARAGDGVLVLGGQDASGTWLTTAEYYDPTTATFTPVEVPEVLGANGFAGTSVTTLPSGDVVISGGPQPVVTLFLSAERRFRESVLITSRAFHTSIAIGEDEVLLAGGCQDVAAGACSGVVRNSSLRYLVSDLAVAPNDGPSLRVKRLGATMLDLGDGLDGQRAFVIAGGTAPAGSDALGVDRITLSGDDAIDLTGAYPHVAPLDGGAVLTVFAGDPAIGDAASVLAPEVATARVTTRAPDLLADLRLLSLEDGRVLGVGGTTNTELALYDPTTDRWQVAPPPATSDLPASLASASLLRLADGSVLVLGAAPATTDAWIYRPSQLGPSTGSVTVVPGGSTTTVLTAPDPATVTRIPDWELSAPGAPDDLARALVGGPRMATGSVQATVFVRAGGLALVGQDLGPGRVLVAQLVPGEPARLVRRAGGAARTACTGKPVPAIDPGVTVVARLEVSSTTMRVLLDDVQLLSCDTDLEERGAWGVGASGPGARVAVETVIVQR